MKAIHVLLDGGSVDRQLRKIDRDIRRDRRAVDARSAKERKPDERRASNRQRQEISSWY